MKSKWPLFVCLTVVCMGLWSCSALTDGGSLGANLTELKLTISEDKKGTPKFSFAAGPSQQAPDISRMDVTLVDDKGKILQYAWSVQSPSTRGAGIKVKEIEYGKVPPGWKETCPATPIQNDLFYSINGVKYFCRDSQGTYSIYSQQSFDQLQPQSKQHNN